MGGSHQFPFMDCMMFFLLLWRQIFTHTEWNWDISSICSHTVLFIPLFLYTHQSLLWQNTLTTWCYYRNGKDVLRFANFHCFSSKHSNCLLTKNFTFVSKNENLCLYFKNTIWLLFCFDVKISSLAEWALNPSWYKEPFVPSWMVWNLDTPVVFLLM